MSQYKLKSTKLEEAARAAYKKIEAGFVTTFLNEDGTMKAGKLGEGVASTYKKVETTVVDSYKKIEDAFIKAFLEKLEEEKEEDTEK